jgi:alpha-tubulin suppressor-like RCC1 family protein
VFATPNPDPDPGPNPDPNPTPEIIVDIAAGEEFTFAVTQSGRVLAWGSDADDQLGDGDGNTNRREAVHVIGADRVTAVGAGSNFGLALRDDGTVLSWGFNANDGRLGTGSSANEIPTAERVFDLENIVAIAAGGGHALALNSSGTVFGWGASKFGAVGDGSQTPRSSPVKLDLPGKAVSVAAGESHSLALLEDGRVYAWGRNHLGQLGLDSTSNEFSPLEVTNTDQDFEKIVAIAAGDNHSVALRKDGIVFAWGDNAAGQLGVFETGGVSLPTFVSAPQAILEVSGVVALEAGGAHTLALRDDGTLLAWGSDAQGQLGDDTTLASSVKPVKVSIDQRVKRFAAGFDHSLALLEDGSVLAWGGNRADQLGDIAGLNEANSPVALRVSLP